MNIRNHLFSYAFIAVITFSSLQAQNTVITKQVGDFVLSPVTTYGPVQQIILNYLTTEELNKLKPQVARYLQIENLKAELIEFVTIANLDGMQKTIDNLRSLGHNDLNTLNFALLEAIKAPHDILVLNLLIETGADINATINDVDCMRLEPRGNSVLLRAIRQLKKDNSSSFLTVYWLLQHGANDIQQNLHGESFLTHVERQDLTPEMINGYKAHKKNLQSEIGLQANKFGLPNVIAGIISEYATINVEHVVEVYNLKRRLLRHARLSSDLIGLEKTIQETIDRLRELGSLNTAILNEALLEAVKTGGLNIISLLVKNCADVNTTTDDDMGFNLAGSSALVLAIKLNWTNRDLPKIVDFLLRHGADVDQKNQAGVSFLTMKEDSLLPEIIDVYEKYQKELQNGIQARVYETGLPKVIAGIVAQYAGI